MENEEKEKVKWGDKICLLAHDAKFSTTKIPAAISMIKNASTPMMKTIPNRKTSWPQNEDKPNSNDYSKNKEDTKNEDYPKDEDNP